jgi:hypothetical protein
VCEEELRGEVEPMSPVVNTVPPTKSSKACKRHVDRLGHISMASVKLMCKIIQP